MFNRARATLLFVLGLPVAVAVGLGGPAEAANDLRPAMAPAPAARPVAAEAQPNAAAAPLRIQDPAPQPPAAPDGGARPAGGDDEFLMGEQALTDEARSAIAGGLRFLVASQDMESGMIAGRSDRRYGIAATGLAGLALLASGSTPGRGPYGENIVKAIEYLVRVQGDAGYYSHGQDHSRIHGHGYALLFLAHTYGMVRDSDLRDSLRRSLTRGVRLTEGAQTELGGWGYQPDDRTFDEASTTITQIQALRACRDVGIKVSDAVVNRAVRYVHNSAVAIDWVDENGTTRQGYNFIYSLRMNNTRVSFPLTAAAVSVLHGAGTYEGRILQGGLDWIFNFFMGRTEIGDTSWYDRWFEYGHFYAAQAMYQAPDERYWNEYFPRLRDILLQRMQRRDVRLPDGRTEQHVIWPSSYGEVYATAINTMILQVPRGYLPLFQR